ncbi:hypothetical protein B0H14DRAFT_3461748 [Mycena olivaceomarginata]|nr:hypothetical protein B0H14DRAFT_3461748 [Mycena olivaceomarginata]
MMDICIWIAAINSCARRDQPRSTLLNVSQRWADLLPIGPPPAYSPPARRPPAAPRCPQLPARSPFVAAAPGEPTLPDRPPHYPDPPRCRLPARRSLAELPAAAAPHTGATCPPPVAYTAPPSRRMSCRLPAAPIRPSALLVGCQANCSRLQLAGAKT